MKSAGNKISVYPCPACENKLFHKRFTKKGREFWQCDSCGMERIDPLPTQEELRSYYDQSYTSGLYKVFTDAQQMKDLTSKQRLKEIMPYTEKGSWLDVGCSNGVFVQAAIENGIKVEGIDISYVAVEQGKQQGLPLYCSSIETFEPEHNYDVLTAFDILEHVLDPYNFLYAARKLLKAGGKVVLTTPNRASAIAKAMGKGWSFYIPEEHMHYFHPYSIIRLFERTGFKIEHIGRTYKPLNLSYALTQFQEYNPRIYSVLNQISRILPKSLVKMIVPIYIGEMMVIACKPE